MMEVFIIIIGFFIFVICLIAWRQKASTSTSTSTLGSRRKPLESRIKPTAIGAQERQPSSQPHKAPETESIEDYSEAIRLDPDDANAYYNRGWDYDELGEYEKAIEDYSQVIRLDPNATDAYNNRGNIYYSLGEYEKALQDYDEAIRLDPDNEMFLENRKLVLAKIN